MYCRECVAESVWQCVLQCVLRYVLHCAFQYTYVAVCAVICIAACVLFKGCPSYAPVTAVCIILKLTLSQIGTNRERYVGFQLFVGRVCCNVYVAMHVAV